MEKMAKMPYQEICERLKLPLDKATGAACRFLESRGLRFCVDFGTENALDIAFQVLDAENWRET